MDTKKQIRPTIQRFSLGDFTVSTILDGVHFRETLNPPFAMDKSDEELAAIGAANRLPWQNFQNSYTLTLIDTGEDRVLIDLGFGKGGQANGAGHLQARLADLGWTPEDITIVLMSHVHPDHILGINNGDDLAFPNARHMIGRREFDEWKKGDLIPAQRKKNQELFMRLIAPLADQLAFLEDGDTVVPGVTTEAAFGHSVGHMMFRIESAGQQLLVWGDVCNHYVYSLQHPSSSVGFDDDKDMAIATRKRVLDMAAADDLLIAGFHMPFPAVGFVERTDESFRWVPATYQI